jgi:hypothetical protein
LSPVSSDAFFPQTDNFQNTVLNTLRVYSHVLLNIAHPDLHARFLVGMASAAAAVAARAVPAAFRAMQFTPLPATEVCCGAGVGVVGWWAQRWGQGHIVASQSIASCCIHALCILTTHAQTKQNFWSSIRYVSTMFARRARTHCVNPYLIFHFSYFSLPRDHHRCGPDDQLGRHALCTLSSAHRVQLWMQPAHAMASAQHARWVCVADLSALWYVRGRGWSEMGSANHGHPKMCHFLTTHSEVFWVKTTVKMYCLNPIIFAYYSVI